MAISRTAIPSRSTLDKVLGPAMGPADPRTRAVIQARYDMRNTRLMGINRAKQQSPKYRGAMHGPGRQELETVMKTAKAEEKAGLKLFKNPKKAAMIGTGLAVAATVAMNRRGKGASSGRQSMYRY